MSFSCTFTLMLRLRQAPINDIIYAPYPRINSESYSRCTCCTLGKRCARSRPKKPGSYDDHGSIAVSVARFAVGQTACFQISGIGRGILIPDWLVYFLMALLKTFLTVLQPRFPRVWYSITGTSTLQSVRILEAEWIQRLTTRPCSS